MLRKLAASLLGGYRTAANDYEEDSLSLGLHLAQILIYLIVPASVLVSVVVLGDQKWMAMIVGGAVPLVINVVLMIVALSLGSDEDSQKSGFLFLFPAKSGAFEVLLAAVLTFVNGALMVYIVNPETTGEDLGTRIPHLVIIGLSSYSLFSQHCPEVAIYRDNDQELNWGSNHYQRSTYCSLLGLAVLAINEGGWAWGSDKMVPWLYHAFIIVYFLQVFGMLSHPLVTLLWAMEQASVHLFGGSPRASDLRILVSFVITSVFIAVPILML